MDDFVSLVYSSSSYRRAPGDDSGALRVRIGDFARTLANTLVDPMLGSCGIML